MLVIHSLVKLAWELSASKLEFKLAERWITLNTRLRTTFALGLVVSLGFGLIGCAPKRVINTAGDSEPAIGTTAKTEDEANAPSTISNQTPGTNNPTQGVNNAPVASTEDGLGVKAVDLARAQIGKPYQWGASGPDKFDCSGLVQYVYLNLGVPLPRVSGEQAGSGVHVDRENLAPGDLVFFRLTGGPINHVGIYVGSGKFIHAPKRYNPVRIDSLNDSWWRQKFKGGRRVG